MRRPVAIDADHPRAAPVETAQDPGPDRAQAAHDHVRLRDLSQAVSSVPTYTG
jgi:hypothetical protein